MSRRPLRKHWTTGVKEQNARLQTEIDNEKSRRFFEAFTRELADNLLLCLTQHPFEAWPHYAKVSFEYARTGRETVADEWKTRLPVKLTEIKKQE
jgi:hypothetical protein